MPRPRGHELDARPAEPSRLVRARVMPAAEQLGQKRPRLGAEARALLTRAVDTLPLSARGRARVARVAATVAALAVRGRDRGCPRRRGALVPGSAGAGDMTYASVSRGRQGYPPLLAELHDPPARLHLRGGSPDVLARPAVAVVGARSCSAYGAQVARELAQSLAAAGVVVVSGLARGIDGGGAQGCARRGRRSPSRFSAAASTATIHGRTPSSRAGSRRRGIVVSEYPPGVEPAPWRFPARNRIIAGLAPGDSRRRGTGALRRADHSRLRARARPRGLRSSGRDHVEPSSAGTNDLLRQGATPLLVRGRRVRKPRARAARAGRSGRPLVGSPRSCWSDSPTVHGRSTSSVRATEIGTAAMAAVLTELELAGLIAVADGVYRRATGRGPPRVVRS